MQSSGCFITGMSRAGTTWLSKCLNEHPEAAVFGESAFFGRFFLEPGEQGKYSPAELEKVAAHAREYIKGLAGGGPGCYKNIKADDADSLVDAAILGHGPLSPSEAFLGIANAVADAEGKRAWIEKTPHHVNWVDRIMAFIPDARFVIMMRDPYGFMLSYKHQGDRKPERVRRNFEALYHPFGCAVVWRGYVGSALSAAGRYPAQVLLVQFSDLLEKPEETLLKVQHFFSLTPCKLADKVPPDNTSFPGGRRPELGGDDLFWMRVMAAKEMRELGAPSRPVPREPARIIISILRLPAWGIRNLWSMRRRANSPLNYLFRWLLPGRTPSTKRAS